LELFESNLTVSYVVYVCTYIRTRTHVYVYMEGFVERIVVEPLIRWMRRYSSTFTRIHTSILPLCCLSCYWRI